MACGKIVYNEMKRNHPFNDEKKIISENADFDLFRAFSITLTLDPFTL